jgi:hypothetical protein
MFTGIYMEMTRIDKNGINQHANRKGNVQEPARWIMLSWKKRKKVSKSLSNRLDVYRQVKYMIDIH